MKKNSINDLKKYREFLETIPLDKYREELKNVKWVEQDLNKAGQIQLGSALLPLASIFKYYWEKRQFLTFEKWFESFWEELNTKSESKQALKEFKKYYFDKNGDGWFKKGFKARMYRTWVSDSQGKPEKRGPNSGWKKDGSYYSLCRLGSRRIKEENSESKNTNKEHLSKNGRFVPEIFYQASKWFYCF